MNIDSISGYSGFAVQFFTLIHQRRGDIQDQMWGSFSHSSPDQITGNPNLLSNLKNQYTENCTVTIEGGDLSFTLVILCCEQRSCALPEELPDQTVFMSGMGRAAERIALKLTSD